MRFSVIIIALFIIGSCHTSWRSTKNQSKYLSSKYSSDYYSEKEETIKLIQQKDTFAYFFSFRGDCEFCNDLFIDDYFTWVESGKQLKKNIKKELEQEYFISKTNPCNNKDLFNFFTVNRIDTIKTLPRENGNMKFVDGYIDSYHPLKGILKVKCGNYSYSKFFDPRQMLNTIDTLHPIYIFVKKIKAL